MRYDIFGSDNAVANKMESEGVPGLVNISEDTRRVIEESGTEKNFRFEFNKIVQVKGVAKEYKSFLCLFDEENKGN